MAAYDFTGFPVVRTFLGARVALLQDGFGSCPEFSAHWAGHMRGDLAQVIEFVIAADRDPFCRVEFEESPGDIYDVDLQELTTLFVVHKSGISLGKLSVMG